MSKEEKENKETWEVEKEFIKDITGELKKLSKKIEAQQEEIDKLKLQATESKTDLNLLDSEKIFQCTELSFTDKPLSKAERNKKLAPFRSQLKDLMEEYRIGWCKGMFLPKL